MSTKVEDGQFVELGVCDDEICDIKLGWRLETKQSIQVQLSLNIDESLGSTQVLLADITKSKDDPRVFNEKSGHFMTYIVDGPGPDVFTTDEFDGKFTKHCGYDENEVDCKYKQIMVLYEENKEIIIAHKY